MRSRAAISAAEREEHGAALVEPFGVARMLRPENSGNVDSSKRCARKPRPRTCGSSGGASKQRGVVVGEVAHVSTVDGRPGQGRPWRNLIGV